MRSRLGPFLLALTLGGVLTLAGCGQDQTGDVSDDPAPTASTPTDDNSDEGDEEPQGKVDFELVEMVTETAAGGDVDPEATSMSDVVAVQEFSKQFESDTMEVRLTETVKKTEVPEGKALYGAVVAIGCEEPPGVVVTSTDSGLTIEGKPTASTPPECFAPMTSVALVLVDEDVVG